MSLGLKDLKKGPKVKEKPPLMPMEEAQNFSPSKKKVLRPWESFDQLGDQTRTLRAKEAVSKAIERTAITQVQPQDAPPPIPAEVFPRQVQTLGPTLTPVWKKRGPAGALHLFFYLLKI